MTANGRNLSIPAAIQVALEMLSPTMAKSFVTKLLKEENIEALKTGEKMLDDLSVSVSVKQFALNNSHQYTFYLKFPERNV